jgi:hypothetical protein
MLSPKPVHERPPQPIGEENCLTISGVLTMIYTAFVVFGPIIVFAWLFCQAMDTHDHN